MDHNLLQLETKIGYIFCDKSLLRKAMTHRSYAAERKLTSDNQRLEFLGDAVIEIIVTEYLFKRYTDKQEGELTALRSSIVKKDTLAEFARQIDLHDYIFLGKGEIEAEGNTRNSTLCDAFEALFGAIYLDSDIAVAQKILYSMLNDIFPQTDKLLAGLNPKGFLQEVTQKKWGVKPEYKIINTKGPQHDMLYVVEVFIDNKLFGTGSGKNIKSAEVAAAKMAMELIDKNKP